MDFIIVLLVILLVIVWFISPILVLIMQIRRRHIFELLDEILRTQRSVLEEVRAQRRQAS